jgi:hypothetical protein
MGRPLRTAETVDGNAKEGVIGANSATGEQIQMIAFVTGGSANNTTTIVQKGTHRFRCTTSDGTETCTLTAVASGSLTAGQCQLTATDSAGGTYYVIRVSPNWIEIGALGTGTQVAAGDRVQWVDDQTSAVAIDTTTYAIGDVNQPGRFQIVTA